MVPPKALCRKHLVAEHHECHVFLGKLKHQHRLDGYITGNHFSLRELWSRHHALVQELERRGYSHASPFPAITEVYRLGGYLPPHPLIDRRASLDELRQRCPDCKKGLG